MKLINEPKSVDLDESYNKNKDKSSSDSLIGDNFYESKTVSIFDDDFQGIEWPDVKKQHKDWGDAVWDHAIDAAHIYWDDEE